MGGSLWRWLSLAWVWACAGVGTAASPGVPAGFEQPQSPPKPAPFPVKLVDQGEFNPALKGYFLPEGFRLEVVASEPEVVNPVGMTFGPHGELYVLEWRPDPITPHWHEVKEVFRYRDGSTREVATMKKFATDWVKELRYDPAQRKFGGARVIIADELPSSILYHEGWLYLSGRGTVRRYRQSVPGGRWDVREVIAQGFCGFHHHQVSGLTLAPDGRLYITTGDDDNVVEGSDGSRATVLRTGAVFRCRLDGSRMELYSLGYRNPYRDIAFDDRFNFFHADNDNEDGSKFMGCRIMHVTEGSDFGWRLREGLRCCRPDLLRGAVAGELPGRLPPMLKTGRGAPAGLLIYNDAHLPPPYRGLLYYPDAYRKLVRAYAVEPTGATFAITGEFEFFKSDDPLFRPCQMITGPDGAIYVCDWRTDSGGAGKLWGDGLHGRIYRITWADPQPPQSLPLRPMDSWSRLRRMADSDLVNALGSEFFTDRLQANQELIQRGQRVVPLVQALVANAEAKPAARYMGLGVLSALWQDGSSGFFRERLRDGDATVRRLAVEAIGLNSPARDEANYLALLKPLSDPEAPVRRAAAIALGRIGVGGTAENLLNALKFEDSDDPFLRDAYVRGIEATGSEGVEAILALAQSGNAPDRDLAVRLFTMLRIRPAAVAIPQMLNYPHLTAAQRESLVQSYANYQLEPPISYDALAAWLAKHPEEPPAVVRAALQVIQTSSGTSGPTVRQWLIKLLTEAEPALRLEAIDAAESLRWEEARPVLLKLASDSARDVTERRAALRALRVFPSPDTLKTLERFFEEREPASLQVEALRTLATLDARRALGWTEKLLESSDSGLVREAAAVLGATPAGAKWLAQRWLSGNLPRDLMPLVTEALYRFPKDADASRLRMEILKGALAVRLEPEELTRIRQRVASQGNPRRGRELFLNTQLLTCVNCHRLEGVGGAVGPDLTRVWDTHSVEKLLESLFAPSREIKEGYQTFRVVTMSGQTLLGLRVQESPEEFRLRDAQGRDIVIPKRDIEELSVSKTSLMPEDSAARLSWDQLIDLLAFLKSRSEQESLRGTVGEVVVSVPTSTDLTDVPAALRQDLAGKQGGPWHRRGVDVDGAFRLTEDFPSKPAGLYLRFWVYSPKEQPTRAVVETHLSYKAWVNGRATFERAANNPGLPAEQTFDVLLNQGWNAVLLKVANPGAAIPRIAIRWQGEGLNATAQLDVNSPPRPAGSSD